MKRSILLSLLIIGAAASLLGSGTFAKFNTFDSDSGVLKAASIGITVNGTGNSLAFSGGGGNCPDALLPGDSCSDTVTVENVSTVSVKILSVTASEAGTLETCGDGNSLTTTTTPNIVGTILAPGGTTTFTITTVFDATATADCQGQSATVGVIVAAESA